MGRASVAPWLWVESTRRIRAAVALSEVSEGLAERAGDDGRLFEECLDACGGVVVEPAAMEVLLKVGTALGRG